jgi:lipooligosaccharide transport system permease protein
MLGFKWNPIFFGMNAAPISGRQIVDGMTIGIAVRTAATCAIYFVFTVVFGAVPNGWGFLLVIVATVTGLAVGLVISAYTATIEEDRGQMALIGRFVVMPLFLFSGTFFPLTALPIWLQWIGWISPLWHGTQLARILSFGLEEPAWLVIVHVLVLVALFVAGLIRTRYVVTRRLNK